MASVNSRETHYNILGVPQTASSDEIKRAYRKLSFIHHPDKNAAPESTKLFQKLAEAYSVLSDTSSREDYDNELTYGFGQKSRQMHTTMSPNPHDLFNMLFGGGGGGGGGGGLGSILQSLGGFGLGSGEIHIIHGGIGGGGGGGGIGGGFHPMMAHMQNMHFMQQQQQQHQQHQQQQQQQQQQQHQQQQQQHQHNETDSLDPDPITLTITVTYEQAYFGESFQVEYDKTVYETPTISSIKRDTVTIAVPRGTRHQEKLIVPNIGNVNAHGKCGSLQFTFNVEPHPVFARDNASNDLILHKKISLKESLCGMQFEFTHLSGKMYQIINKNPGAVIQPESIKTIKGLGFERSDGSGGSQVGSLQIVFHVEYPESISPDLYETLATIL